MNTKFSDILSEFLKGEGMKQKDFAYNIGVSPSQVSEWLKDKATPNYHTLKRICLAFNISADYFLGITDGY